MTSSLLLEDVPLENLPQEVRRIQQVLLVAAPVRIYLGPFHVPPRWNVMIRIRARPTLAATTFASTPLLTLPALLAVTESVRPEKILATVQRTVRASPIHKTGPIATVTAVNGMWITMLVLVPATGLTIMALRPMKPVVSAEEAVLRPEDLVQLLSLLLLRRQPHCLRRHRHRLLCPRRQCLPRRLLPRQCLPRRCRQRRSHPLPSHLQTLLHLRALM